MFSRSSYIIKSLILVVLAFAFTSVPGFAQNQDDNKPQTQPDNPKNLFEPIDFLPVFKKWSLPDEKIIEDLELQDSLRKVFKELRVSWLKSRMFNELFELMKTRKHQLFKEFINEYFKTISSFDWKVSDFEALVKQYSKIESRKIIENLLNTKFDYDEEFAVRLPFLFFYQKTFADAETSKEVANFLGLLQKKMEKPESNSISNYFWISMLMLASGDETKLTEIQDWLFNAYFEGESTILLNTENFKNIIIKAISKNLTQKFVDSGSWNLALEQALTRNIMPELNQLFEKDLKIPGFAKKSFEERYKVINANIQPYYALTALLNGEKDAFETVSKTISRIGRLSSIVMLLEPNNFNKKYVTQVLWIVFRLLKSPNYSERFSAKEALRRFLLFSDEINTEFLLEMLQIIKDANLSTSELQESQTVLMFLAASIKDEVVFEEIFAKLHRDTKIQQFLNNIRNQFYRSSEYFNENLKKILGKKILSILTPEMPFSEYAVFDILKEFADVKEIAEEILSKIPEWYTMGNERNRRFFFSYTGTISTFEKISVIFPKKTAQLIIPMYSYLDQNEQMYESTRKAIYAIFSRCGMNCAGYLQQLYEQNKDKHFLFLLSGIKNKEICGFVFEILSNSNLDDKSEIIEKILENMKYLIEKDKIALLAPYMLNESRNERVKLSAFITILYVLSS